MFSECKKLNDEAAVWLRSRPEWGEFLKLVREDLRPDDPRMKQAAMEAGVSVDDRYGLPRLRASALRAMALASTFPDASREYEKMRREVHRIQTRSDATKDPREFQELQLDGVVAAEAAATYHRDVFCSAQTAANLVKAAKEAGVL